MTARQLSIEMNELELSGLRIPNFSSKIGIQIDISCMDRKAADILQGTGGAYCDLCAVSDSDCQKEENILNMKITRNVNTAQAIYEMLADDNGNIVSSKGDYAVRQGVTNEPILKKNVLSAQPLHGRMRSFDFYMKLATHLKAGLDPKSSNFWSESKSRYDLQFIKSAKEDIQTYLKNHRGIKLDIPDGVGARGTTTTGNIARRLMNNDKSGSRDHFTECIPPQYKEQFASILSRHAIVLNVLNSKKEIKQIEQLREFSHSIYRDILLWFPKAHITPTVHKMLAHSWELISMNGGRGLGIYAEEGLEGCNKYLRRFRVSLSRKCGKEENQLDCVRRLWDKSDPVSNKHREDILPSCKTCNTKGHSTRYCSAMKETVDKIYQSFFE